MSAGSVAAGVVLVTAIVPRHPVGPSDCRQCRVPGRVSVAPDAGWGLPSDAGIFEPVRWRGAHSALRLDALSEVLPPARHPRLTRGEHQVPDQADPHRRARQRNVAVRSALKTAVPARPLCRRVRRRRCRCDRIPGCRQAARQGRQQQGVIHKNRTANRKSGSGQAGRRPLSRRSAPLPARSRTSPHPFRDGGSSFPGSDGGPGVLSSRGPTGLEGAAAGISGRPRADKLPVSARMVTIRRTARSSA